MAHPSMPRAEIDEFTIHDLLRACLYSRKYFRVLEAFWPYLLGQKNLKFLLKFATLDRCLEFMLPPGTLGYFFP